MNTVYIYISFIFIPALANRNTLGYWAQGIFVDSVVNDAVNLLSRSHSVGQSTIRLSFVTAISVET